jgi:hypothetical protein
LALSIIGQVGWIDTSRLGQFIMNCQDNEDGGIADSPRDMPDVYHTFFGPVRAEPHWTHGEDWESGGGHHSVKIALIDDASLVAYPQNVPCLSRGVVGLTTVPFMMPPPFPPFNVGDVF